jgi:galactonate dehydratase
LIFVRVRDRGYGEGRGEPTLEFQSRAVSGALIPLTLVIGENPRRLEDLWQAMYRYPFFKGGVATMSALSGIDQALRDIFATMVTPRSSRSSPIPD